MALDGQGKIYSWGGGGSKFNKGQCGHGDFQDIEYPKQIEYFKDQKISKISAGGYHSLALTIQNDLYLWGAEVFGDMNNTPVPKLIKFQAVDENDKDIQKFKTNNQI